MTLLNVDNNISQETRTDASGEYIFTPVRIGNYTVTATAVQRGQSVGHDQQLLVCEEVDREMADIRSKPDLMARLARVSGGKSFTLADNEQWDEDNNHKMAHTPESHGPSGATLAAEEEHILRCLGAALIMQWNALSTKLRRELFDNAGSMGELLETPALRGQVARFLHKHKDDEDYSSNMIRTEKTDAAAVARWDDEGGAAKTSPGKQDLPKQNGRRSIQKTPAHQAEIDHKQEASHATHPIGRG